MGRLYRFLHSGEDILFEVIKGRDELSHFPLYRNPILIPCIFLGFMIACLLMGMMVSWIYYIFAGICLTLSIFLFYVINSLEKSERKKERFYIITKQRIIEKSRRVFHANFSNAPQGLLEFDDDIAAIDLSDLEQFEIEKRKYIYYINFYLKNDPSNQSWVTFRGLKTFEKEALVDTLTELMQFNVSFSAGLEIYIRK